jgi:hypothetical protein
MTATIAIEPTGAKDTGICTCCGRESRVVWGNARSAAGGLAVYYVHWTLGHVPDQGANIDLVIGKWVEDAAAEDRQAVAIAYRLMETGPSMMVIDAAERPVARNTELVGRALRREDVVETPLATQAFAIADAILEQDERVAELLGR